MNTTLKEAADVAKDAADATVHRISDLVGDLGGLVSRPTPRRRGRSMWFAALAVVIVGIAFVALRARRPAASTAEDVAVDSHRPAAARRSEVAIS